MALAFVRLERACLAAKGRALGTGYVDVPGMLSAAPTALSRCVRSRREGASR